jgi:hypothetical protein
MEENDKKLAASKAYLKMLVDSSAFLSLQDIGAGTGIHPLNIIEENPNLDYFFTSAVANELIKSREGLNPNTLNILKKSLRDEMTSGESGHKEARTLYKAKDGSIKVATLTAVSGVDQGQILLCQNHRDIVLLTNDHRMLKNAAAVLDNRLMDVLNLLELMSDVPDKTYQHIWTKMRKYYEVNSDYKRPKTVRCIEDRRPRQEAGTPTLAGQLFIVCILINMDNLNLLEKIILIIGVIFIGGIFLMSLIGDLIECWWHWLIYIGIILIGVGIALLLT